MDIITDEAFAGGGSSNALRSILGFGTDPGNLRMTLFDPGRTSRQTRPLVVALHGCTQDAQGFADYSGWLSLAREHGFLLLLPEQREANNRKSCFSWFEPGDVARGEGEVESIRQMIGYAVRDCGADPARTFVTGLSAGGAMTCAMLAAYPEVFAGGAIVAGLPYGSAKSVVDALDAMFLGRTRDPKTWGDAVRHAAPTPPRWPAVAIWQGTGDGVVKPINAGELVKQWTNVHGVAAQVPREDHIGTATRRVWRDADERACVIEYSLPGLAHGMPVADTTPPAPFYLPAGLSAATQIARDFGILRIRKPRTPRLLERLGLGARPANVPA